MKSMIPVFIALPLIASAGVEKQPVVSSSKPNILYILADDLGYADISANGWEKLEFSTPNIDSIFTAGARFKAGFVSNSVCAPSRAGLLTGRAGSRFGFERNIPHSKASKPGSTIGLDVDQKTLADVLKSVGYKTYAIGKWHLGDNDDLFYPTKRGFDEFYGMVGGSRSYFHREEYDHGKSIEHNGTWVEEPKDMYITDFLTDQALEYITDQTQNNPDQPWFMYMSYTAPHGPMHAKQADIDRVPLASHFDKYKHQPLPIAYKYIVQEEDGALSHLAATDNNILRQVYGAMVVSMDDNVGRLLSKLDELGLKENTIVIFHSDNGGPQVRLRKNRRVEGGVNWSKNGSFKGRKGELWEGGIRVPFAISWPGTVSSGQVFGHDCPVSSLDMMPTFAAVSGADATQEILTDGINLIPLLKNDVETTAPRKLYWRRGGGRKVALRSGHFKYYRAANGKEHLFDHETGGGEWWDGVADKYPEKFSQLQDEYDEWESTLPENRW